MFAYIILLLLFILWYAGLSLYFIGAVIIIIYWLPKFLFIALLERLYPDVVTRLNNTGAICLTFDDLPDGNHKEIINILDQYEMKATFFVISSQINYDNINDFVEAVRNGHQLGNHGDTNSAHYFKSKDELETEIIKCDFVIKRIYELAEVPLPTTMCYRPGCGLFGGQMLDITKKLGYKLALGSVYPNDPVIRNGIINYYYLKMHIQADDIVILHDRAWTVAVLERLLPWLQANHLTSITLNNALKIEQ